MPDKFVVVIWPESQDFIGKKNCHLINDEEGFMKYGKSAYFVRQDIYDRINWLKLHSRKVRQEKWILRKDH